MGTGEKSKAENVVSLLRLPEVIERTGLPQPSLYRMSKAGEFPRPVKLGERSVAWRSDEVNAWIESRPVARG